MAIPLHTAGGFFTRFGHIGGRIQDINALRGGPATARVLSGAIMTTGITQLETDYAASPNNLPVLNGVNQNPPAVYQALTSWQQTAQSFLQYFASLAQQTLVTMANQDTPLAQQTVTQAMALLISQMKSAAKSVNQSVASLGAQTSVGSPNGNPIIVLGITDNNGLALQYLFGETITFTCTADSQSGGTLNKEQITVTSPAADSNELDYLWPLGSGISQSLNCIDPLTQTQQDSNGLNNSAFETWTVANTPDGWTITVGAAGTNVFQGSGGTNFYDGTSSLQITGDVGGTLTALKQQFGVSSGGTSYTLKPLTTYVLNFWIRTSATPAAGVLVVELIDGTNTVIQDAAGTNNTVSKSLTAVSTSWVNVNAIFRTPALMPAAQYLRLRLSTAIDNTKSLFIDRMSFTKPTLGNAGQLYPGGPFCVVFSGNTKLLLGDSYTIAVTQTWGVIQQLMEQCFQLRNLGMVIPFSGAPTELDSLVS